MKKYIIYTVVYLIFLLVFDGLFLYFVDIQACKKTMLVAAGGLNAAYLSLLLIPALSPRQRGQMVLTSALYIIGIFYFIAELIVVVCFMIWPPETILWPIVVQAGLMALYIIVLLSSVAGNDATQKAVAEQRQMSRTVHDRADTMSDILTIVQNLEAKKLLSKCRDELNACPLRSTAEISPIEDEIDSLIMIINDYAVEGSIDELMKTANRLRLTINKRNSRLKRIDIY